MKKRGQMTLFIIIGIAILAIVTILVYYFYFVDDNFLRTAMKGSQMSRDINKIRNDMDSCIRDSASELIFLLGHQGGNIGLREEFITIDGNIVHYGYYKKKVMLPSKVDIQNTISELVSSQLESCVNVANYRRYDFKFNKKSLRTVIKDDKVDINMAFGITISDENNTEFSLPEDYTIEIPLRFGRLYSAATDIIDYQKSNPSELCLTCVLSILDEHEIDSDIQTLGEDTAVFFLSDPMSKVDDEELHFMFAVKF